MTNKDSNRISSTGRRRKLENELASLRGQLSDIGTAGKSRQRSPESSTETARLEQRIAELEEELDRIELARELERQQDA